MWGKKTCRRSLGRASNVPLLLGQQSNRQKKKGSSPFASRAVRTSSPSARQPVTLSVPGVKRWDGYRCRSLRSVAVYTPQKKLLPPTPNVTPSVTLMQCVGRGFSFSPLFGKVLSMVVRMRHTRSQTANRRSHHALKAQKLAVCECGAPRVSHRACAACGRYRGRIVIDVVGKASARAKKRAKAADAKKPRR